MNSRWFLVWCIFSIFMKYFWAWLLIWVELRVGTYFSNFFQFFPHIFRPKQVSNHYTLKDRVQIMVEFWRVDGDQRVWGLPSTKSLCSSSVHLPWLELSLCLFRLLRFLYVAPKLEPWSLYPSLWGPALSSLPGGVAKFIICTLLACNSLPIQGLDRQGWREEFTCLHIFK